MKTRATEMFGIDVPIFAFSHCRDVVAAVSKAGGLGVLGAVSYGPEQLEVELNWIDDQVGDRPYGVDVLVPATYVGVERGGLSGPEARELIPAQHRQFVEDLLRRYGVPDLPQTNAPSTARSVVRASHEGAHRLLDVAWAHPNIRLVASALGPAPEYMVDEAHRRHILVAGLVGKVDHAERQQAAGVDLVVAQGSEAGGHSGEISTMVLVPQIVDAVAPTPVLAAGGIADGRQVAAALALGAQGVWCGSVWLTTNEAETHPVVKEKFLQATSADTVRSRSKTGKPARQLRSAWTDEWSNSGSPDPLPMPLQGLLTRNAEHRIARSAATSEGARQLITYYIGQVVGQLREAKPARQVVYEMVDQYIEATGRLATFCTEGRQK